MNLWARILGLVAIPALLLGCERDDLKIGLPPNDSNFDLGYLEYSLSPSNMIEDSITLMATGRILVGSYVDPYFDSVAAIGYSSMKPDAVTAPAIAEGILPDSLILYLKFSYAFATEQDFEVNFKVHETLFILNSTNVYESFTEQPLGEELAEVFYLFPPEAEFEETGEVLLAIPIKQSYADALLDSLRESNDVIQTEDDFKKFITGLAFVPQEGSNGIIGFNIADAETELVLYWTEENENRNFEIQFSEIEHYNYIYPNEVASDRTGTPLEGLMGFHTEYQSPDEYIYYKSGTGIGITAEAASLKALADTLDNTVITTAVMEIEGIENPTFQPVPQFLRMYLTDETNDKVFYNDQILRLLYQGSRSDLKSVSVPSFGANSREQLLVYNSELNKYQADITLYMQSYLEDRVDLTKIWIYDPRTAASISSFRTLKENIKIKIYYTKAVN